MKYPKDRPLKERQQFDCFVKQALAEFEKLEFTEEQLFEAARQAIGEYDINAPPLTKNKFANEFLKILKEREVFK